MRELAKIVRQSESNQANAAWNNFALHLMRGGGKLMSALKQAEANKAPGQVIEVLKAAVAAGNTTDTNWATSLVEYSYLQNGFAEALRNVGVFDTLLAGGMRRLPLRTRIVATTTAGVGSSVAEGKPKTITRLTLAGDTLKAIKASAIVVLSEELVMGATNSGAMGFLGTELRNAVALSTDSQFFSIALNGISATATAGVTGSDALTDLQTLLAAVPTGAASSLYFVTTPAIAKQLAFKSDDGSSLMFPAMSPGGGRLGMVPCLVSDALAAGSLVLLDASGFCGGSDIIVLDSASHASLQMSDTPDDPVSGSTVDVSLWQEDLRALRAERFFGVNRFRSNAVAAISGATYPG